MTQPVTDPSKKAVFLQISQPAHKLPPACPDPPQAEHGQAMTLCWCAAHHRMACLVHLTQIGRHAVGAAGNFPLSRIFSPTGTSLCIQALQFVLHMSGHEQHTQQHLPVPVVSWIPPRGPYDSLRGHRLPAIRLTCCLQQHEQQAPCPAPWTRCTHIQLPCHSMQPVSTPALCALSGAVKSAPTCAHLHHLCDCKTPTGWSRALITQLLGAQAPGIHICSKASTLALLEHRETG